MLWLTGVAATLLVAALLVYLSYRAEVAKYVYEYPPGALSSRHIRGEYHQQGLIMIRGLSTSAAVARAGGVAVSVANEVLWTTESMRQVQDRLVRHYALLIVLTTAAMFVVAFTAVCAKK